jgi:tetratricopeptide (TPR) repeat protein
MKKVICLFLVLFLVISCKNAKKDSINVLTLGTIHSRHLNSHYSYGDILNILNSYKPDLICVEIRPEDFRKKIYLYEMMLAATFGDINKIQVVPIDWWDEKNNDRTIRDSLSKTDKYINLIKVCDSLEKNDVFLKKFNDKFGDVYKNNDLDINFWNGKEYNDQVRESYKISVSVFGDSPFNLHYVTRNRRMLNNIRQGIEKYKAKKAIILCGAEHKSFFDDSLQTDKKMTIVNLNDILPLKNINIEEIIAKQQPKLYFETIDSQKTDQFYKDLIMPYVHGPDMDFDISNIKLSNLPLVNIMIKNWQVDSPLSPGVIYEWAWYYFLKQDYENSIKYCNLYIETKNPKNLVFDKGNAYRILGFCYDLKNEHQKAIGYYKQAKETMIKLKKPERIIKALLDDYENKPYRR